MRPRPSGRGERFEDHLDEMYEVFLQCGHGLRAVENIAGPSPLSDFITPSMRPRPSGQGELRHRLVSLLVLCPPSMRPRPSGRGELAILAGKPPVEVPSMRPRPSGRGERNLEGRFGISEEPSMRPRPSGRGE